MICPICAKEYEPKLYFEKGRNRWKLGPIHMTCSRVCGQELRFREREVNFWRRVDQSGGPEACWPWTGYCDTTNGYGVVGWKRSLKRAHRIAYELSNGGIDPTLDVLHRCDNRRCCNPAHLWQGKHSDNMKDMVRKGRSADKRGRSNGRAIVSNDDVRAIRKLYASGSVSQQTLANRYGISQTAVSKIVRRTRWTHVPDEA